VKMAGQIILTPFPYTDLTLAKLRPVLILKKASERHDDWLVCMISSQIQQAEIDFDDQICLEDTDFIDSGLKTSSVLRLSRLAVLASDVMVGSIGAIGDERLTKIRQRLSNWIKS